MKNNKSKKMGDENTRDINDELKKNGIHPHITVIVTILKIIFFIYDIVTFIPFKIFADPAKKLEFSSRVKASPNDDDSSKPWIRHDETEEKFDGTTFPGCDTIAKQWNEIVKRFSDSPCMGTREVLEVHKEKQSNGKVFEKWEMGEYHWRSYAQIDERTNLVGSGLEAIGHKDGFVVLFAETREEWTTTAFACFKKNYPIVTVYATLGEEAVEFAITEVAAETVFTSETLLPKVRKAIKNGAKIKRVIYFENHDPTDRREAKDEGFYSFNELLNKGDVEPVESKAKPDDIAVIMYTSGTTGNPKGVMISHRNIVSANSGQGAILPIQPGDTFIAYLPLAHILEICAELVCLSKGCRLGYSSAQTLFDRAPKIKKGTKGDCAVLKPNLIACVPAVMDRIYKAVVDEVNSNSLLFREMFRTCYERKRSRYEDGYTSFILNRLVFNKIGRLLGGELKFVLSGGAPLSPETQRFMNICFCCPVIQGYGLTETCGAGTIADPHDLSTGSVGPPLLGCQVLLEEWKDAGYSPKNEKPQGEILIGGDIVALGYYKNDKKTKEDFVTRNGVRYFATGDIGEFREDGSLKIIDRKKDLLKLSHGEYISLGKVETHLLTNPLVDNVCVYGDSNKDYLVALVVPNQKNVVSKAEELGLNTKNFEKLCEEKKLVEAVQKELEQYVSGKLQRVEIPKKLYLCAEQWTPASGLLTEALKLKRKNVENEFKDQIEKMYK